MSLRGVSKSFGATRALRNVTLEIGSGSVHALVGENGAGKSTLAKVIAGLHTPDEGSYQLGGEPVQFRSPAQALQRGVTMIAQELALVPSRSVLENVFLGRESHRGPLLDRASMRERYRRLLAATGFAIERDARVADLSVAQQQQVEILRAVARDADLIVMDEPTARLSAGESETLYRIIRDLVRRGTTIVLVSHFLNEVLALAQTVTVMRDGEVVRTADAGSESPGSLIAAMVGRAVATDRPTGRRLSPAVEVLRVEGLGRDGAFENVGFSVRQGEIVGLAGLVGSGRSEVARAIFGADPADRGDVAVAGERISRPTIRRMLDRGVAMIPESRKTQGLFLTAAVRENVSLRHLARVSPLGFVRRCLERARVEALAAQFDVRCASIEIPVASLSGGNQQKVLFARWLMERPRLLIADEPTSGVDIGAKRAIHEVLADLAGAGVAVLLISSEIEELLALADRVLVMRNGAIVDEFAGDEATEQRVIEAAFGSVDASEGKPA